MLLVEKLLYSSKYVVLTNLHINVTIFFNLLKKNINNKSHKDLSEQRISKYLIILYYI